MKRLFVLFLLSGVACLSYWTGRQFNAYRSGELPIILDITPNHPGWMPDSAHYGMTIKEVEDCYQLRFGEVPQDLGMNDTLVAILPGLTPEVYWGLQTNLVMRKQLQFSQSNVCQGEWEFSFKLDENFVLRVVRDHFVPYN